MHCPSLHHKVLINTNTELVFLTDNVELNVWVGWAGDTGLLSTAEERVQCVWIPYDVVQQVSCGVKTFSPCCKLKSGVGKID